MTRAATEVVRALGGAAAATQIVERCSRHALRAAVTRGELVRVRRGVYSVPRVPGGALAVAESRGVLSHQSAASHWSMDQLNPAAAIHVTVGRNDRPTPRQGVQLHYGDVTDEHVTSPVRTVLDCARVLPFADALAIADSACRRRLVTPAQLQAAALALRGAGRRRIARVVAHADGRADNPFESALRAILVEAGITGFEPQLVVPGTRPVIRVDLGDPARRIVLEADSFAHHGDRQALHRDCTRYDELVSRDWLVLRFSWEHVVGAQRWVARTVSQTCALRDAATPARRRGRRRAPGAG